MNHFSSRYAFLAVVAAVGPACMGEFSTPNGTPAGSGGGAVSSMGGAGGVGGVGGAGAGGSGGAFVIPSSAGLFTNGAFGKAGIQRLTRRQYLASVEANVGIAAGAAAMLMPADSPSATYFDNDSTSLGFSLQLISDYESFALEYAKLVKADRAGFAARAGCTPTGASDSGCFRKFAEKVGRRFFRRPITAAESQRYAAAFMPTAQADNNFYSAVELMVAAWLQHPEFIYRVEAGAPAAGQLQALTPYEVASRIAFIITGVGPDDVLLDAAAAGQLSSEANRAAQAERLFGTPAAVKQAQFFHSRWFDYGDTFFPAALNGVAQQESDALVERVTMDGARDWLSVFTADETYVTPTLAQHYSLSPPSGSSGWVMYPSSRGGGILSHATLASLGAKFGDTSPSHRGYELFKRGFCGHLTGMIPPGVDVNTQPGAPTDCKDKRYYMRTVSACSSCHGVIDNLGFGLENLGAYGEWRTNETINTACVIPGDGTVNGVAFNGPKALGALMANDPKVAACATTQLFRAVVGRPELPEDAATLEALLGQYYETRSYRSLLVAMVKSPAVTFKGAN